MSRRAKLWIAAVFLLLMTGPVVYLVLSWSPENPLRFRVVESTTPTVRQVSEKQVIVVEVENTTSFPLMLFRGDIGEAGVRIANLGTIWPNEQMDPAVRVTRNGIELGGLQRVRVLVTMDSTWRDRATKHGAIVKYLWSSESEYWFAMQWLKVPYEVRRHLSQPEEGRDETPLEPFVENNGP